MNKRPVVYYQTDPRWKNKPYAVHGESSTIGGSGCGPTAVSMVLATWCNPAVTPETECNWALNHKPTFKALNHGTYYTYVKAACSRYGLNCSQLNGASIYGNSKVYLHKYVEEQLDKGHLVIACMGKGLWTSSGHFVLVWKIEGNTIYINDPASNRKVRTQGDYSLFKQQVKYYWDIEPPKGKEEEDMTEAETRKIVQAEIGKQLASVINPPVYNALEQVPDWGQETVKKLDSIGALKGTGAGYGLTLDMLRILVILDRWNKAGGGEQDV